MPKMHWVKTPYGLKLFIKNPNAQKEISWTLAYIKGRYKNPTNALSFHDSHNWY